MPTTASGSWVDLVESVNASSPALRAVFDALLAITLGLTIGKVYARAYRGILLSASFVHTLAIAVLLITLAVAAVREAGPQAQALGFALVGLLGLIRFRTVVRDTREFSFIFLAIVTGTMIGSGREGTAIFGCGLSLILLVSLEKIGFGAPQALALRIRITGASGQLASYVTALANVAERVEPVGVRVRSQESTTYAFELLGRTGRDIDDVCAAIQSVSGTGEVSISRIQRGKGGGGTEED